MAEGVIRPGTRAIDEFVGSAASEGVNLIGHASGNFGVGVSLRHVASALADRGVPFAVHDVSGDAPLQGRDESLTAHRVASAADLPYRINIFCFTPQETLERVAGMDPVSFRWGSRLNVAMFWWELPQIPPHWGAALSAFDVLLCGSWFIRELASFQIAGPMALHFRHPMQLPSRTATERSAWGVPTDRFAFYLAFDPFSSFERKNPDAVLAAFRRAFQADEPVHLVLKANVSPENERRVPDDARRFLDACRADSRVTVILKSGAYAESLAILEACGDCFVSLHRSEGLGLGPMEAMLLGKPTILTAWSGSMAYSGPSSSCLVPCGLVETKGWTVPSYDPAFLGARTRWAEPSIESAAISMRRVFDDPAYRDSVARRGHEQICGYTAEAAKCEFVDDLRSLVELKAAGGLPSPTLEEARARIARARSGHFGLRIQRAKRWLAPRVPGLWRYFYG